MCGAPVLPAIPTRFVYRPQAAAADVTDVGSPGSPSTPPGWSSSLKTTSAPPHNTMAESYAAYAALLSQQQLMAAAARGLLAASAAQQQMERPPDRQAPATRGAAPVPPPIKMRFVPNPNTIAMPAADVIDAGSSAPSTPPSHCSSSLETTPSPRGALPPSLPDSAAAACASQHPLEPGAAWGLATTKPPMAPSSSDTAAAPCAFQHLTPGGAAWGPTTKLKPPMAPSSSDSAAASCASQHHLTPGGAAWGLATKPPLPFPTAPAPAPRVEVRQVWAHNFEQEAKLIESLLPKFRYVAVDTEFPGTVYRPASPAHTLKPAYRYKLLRSTVDALDPIQLGLTLFDADCRLPSITGDGGTATATAGATRYVWEFNFREFDVRRDRHAEGVGRGAARAKGVDLDRTRRDGVDAAAAFGPRLRKWARAGLGRAGVVTASGGYDLAYLVKLMLGPGFRMPATAAEFEAVAAALLQRRRRVFDVREMARLCPSDDGLRAGLDGVAAKLNAAWPAGEARQAGFDSLLTCYTFVKLREICFDDDGKLTSVDGVLADTTAF